MIYYFNDYFALLAAIYFTMCLDKILTQRIWSNDYFDNFSNAICQSSAIAESIAGNIITNSKKDVNDIQDMLIKKSVYMLSLVAMILVFCGIEQGTPAGGDELKRIQVAISGTAMMSFFMFNIFFSKYIHTKWWCTIFAMVVNVVVYDLFWHYWDLLPSFISYELGKYSSIIVVMFFTLPIIWQIWVCIVYKILYPSYIDRAIKRIGADYQNAQDCIENGDPNQIPAGYRKVFDKHTLKNRSKTVQEVIDSSLDEYVAVLQEDIQEAGINVNAHQIFFRLMKYYVLDCIDYIKNTLLKLNKTKNSVPSVSVEEITLEKETIVRYGYVALKKEYQESGMSINEFCSMKGINKNEFKKYIKER